MNSTDIAVLESAFAAAVLLEGEARDMFLADFARRYPELEAALRSLLAADDDGAFVGSLVSASLERLSADRQDDTIGRRFGAWTVTGIVGSGGMGHVYRAKRSDGAYEQVAALKLMARHLASGAMQGRFLAERQILASLSHPNIARLVDGGTGEGGIPFLVMELVEGERIDRFCETHALSVAQRIALVREICEAVDYAHRQLVIHRDLKPSNILVDSGGRPTVLDFGIAKLLDPGDAGAASDMTQEARPALTPEYASPEQVRGQRVGVATDVYSLGVLLYRLLTGRSPYGESVSECVHELERAILDSEPSRPSAAVTRVGEETGATPPASAGQLKRELKGDLDNIVLKCLQKDPERRYASVAALADDLKNYLTGYPVAARGEAWSYRAHKFARRNSAALGVSGAVVIGVIAMTAYHTARLARERDRAELALTQATEVSGFLTGIFESASPFEAQGEEVTAGELLERANTRIDALDGQPDLQARLLAVVGETYVGLGDFDSARDAFRRADEKWQAGFGRPGAEPDISLRIQIENGLGESDRLHGDFDAALGHRHAALALSESYYGMSHPQSANIRARIGATLSAAGRCDEGVGLLKTSAGQLQGQTGEYNAMRLNALGVLAVCYDTLGRYDEAESIGRRIVRESERDLGRLEPNTIIRIGNLALVLQREGKWEESARLFNTALDRADRALPDYHTDRVDYRNKLANVLQKLGRFEKADTRLSEAEALIRTYGGEQTAERAASYYFRGGYYRNIGNSRAASDSFAKAIALSDRLYGEGSYLAIIASIARAGALRQSGDLDGAESMLDTIGPRLSEVGIDHQSVAGLQRAIIASQRGQFPAATQMFEQLHADQVETLGKDSVAILPMLLEMCAHFRRAELNDRALRCARDAVRIGKAGAPEGNWMTAHAMGELALALSAKGESKQARKWTQQAREVLIAVFGPTDWRVQSLRAIR